MNAKKGVIIAVAFATLIALFTVTRTLVFTNSLGYYKVKQSFGTGTVTVYNQPGVFLRLGGDIFEYPISDNFYFSKHDADGGKGPEAAAIKIQFSDGSKAELTGVMRFKLSANEEKQIQLHREYRNYAAVQDLIRQVVTESLWQTASLMKADEFYTSRRSEFTSLAEAQILRGIFETTSKEYKIKDVEGNEFIERATDIKRDEHGQPVTRKDSPFSRYGIEIVSFVIKDIDFDPTIDALIAKKKEAEQQKVVARANAERAKQDAITATEQGKAHVEEARAKELVEKIKAVTQAQKEFEVAQLTHKKAGEEAAAAILRGEADAKVARQKVAAGLTPLEKAQIEKDTAIGVAAELAKVQFPEMMVIGGGQNGSALNPFDAVGLESLMNIQKKLVKKTKSDETESSKK